MRSNDNPIQPQEIGRQLGMESTDATLEKVEAYCALQMQKIELKNKPRILALKREGALLVEEERVLSNKLQGAPSSGDIRNRKWRAIYYWSVTALLSIAGFFLLIYTFAPFRIGSVGILYCLGAATVVPFLLDLAFGNPARRKVCESLAMVACIVGLTSLILLALIRGDLLAQELQTSAPAVIFDNDQPGPEAPANQPDFYQETAMLLRLALMLLAFSMDVGAGLALWKAKQILGEDVEDWEKLRTRRDEIHGRLIAVEFEIGTLANEPHSFFSSFWAEYYKAALTHTLRSAVGKFLLSVILLFTLVAAHEAAAAVKTQLVIAVDLTKSVAVKDANGKTEFEKNVAAVTQLLSNISPNSRITILGITDHSFTQPDILLSATVPADSGYFEERLKKARNELVRAWKDRTAHLSPHFSQTDIIGALFLASEILRKNAASSEKVLVILSDMQNSTRELDLESAIPARLPSSPEGSIPLVNLQGVRVQVIGVDSERKSIAYWQNLRNFWAVYLQRAKANLILYAAIRQTEMP